METKTVPRTGLVQKSTKGWSPNNTTYLLLKEINPIASVFGDNLKLKCFVNQDIWWEECNLQMLQF